uniref:Uncharacterized protein n=1 Tax=Panthera leo TaxID=9689 RepID=A0A8C8WYM3_PANLE
MKINRWSKLHEKMLNVPNHQGREIKASWGTASFLASSARLEASKTPPRCSLLSSLRMSF